MYLALIRGAEESSFHNDYCGADARRPDLVSGMGTSSSFYGSCTVIREKLNLQEAQLTLLLLCDACQVEKSAE